MVWCLGRYLMPFCGCESLKIISVVSCWLGGCDIYTGLIQSNGPRKTKKCQDQIRCFFQLPIFFSDEFVLGFRSFYLRWCHQTPCRSKCCLLAKDFVAFLKTTRWWFQIFFTFTPIPGEDFQFDEHIFQMGWFNHQLDNWIRPENIIDKFQASIFIDELTPSLGWRPSQTLPPPSFPQGGGPLLADR